MHSSVTSGSFRIGRSARRFSSSAEAVGQLNRGGLARSWRAPSACRCSVGHLQCIHGPEIHVPRDEDLDPIALGLGHGGRDVDRAAQDLGHDIGRTRGTDDHRRPRCSATARPLNGAIDHGQEDRRTKAIPEMPVDLAGQARAPSSSVPGELKGTTTPVGVRASFHRTKMRECPAGPGRGSRRRASCRAPGARPAVGAEGIGRRDAGRHPGQRRVDRGLERAIDEGALGEQEPLGSAAPTAPPPALRSVAAAPGAGRCYHRLRQYRHSRRASPMHRRPPPPPTESVEPRANAGPARRRSIASSPGIFVAQRGRPGRHRHGRRVDLRRGRRRCGADGLLDDGSSVFGAAAAERCARDARCRDGPQRRQRHLALGVSLRRRLRRLVRLRRTRQGFARSTRSGARHPAST